MKLFAYLSVFITIGVQGLRIQKDHELFNDIVCMKKGGDACGTYQKVCCKSGYCNNGYCPTVYIYDSNTAGGEYNYNYNSQLYPVDPSRNPFGFTTPENYWTSWKIN